MQKTHTNLMAHRVAYELTHGPIPEGKLVLHRCDNRICVRPDHLFLGTDLDNAKDMYSKGRGHKSHGENQHLSKLTDDAVAEIRRERRKDPPTPLADLATRYGVSLVAVSWAATGKTWKHVSEAPVVAQVRGSSRGEKGRFS